MTTDHEDAVHALERHLVALGRTPWTIYLFGRTARIFLAATAKPMPEITTEDVRSFLAMESERVSLVSQRATFVHLRALFRALIEAKLVEKNPTEGLSIRKPPKKSQLFLSSDALVKLMATALIPVPACMSPVLQQAVALRTRALVELLYGSTVRAVEACRVLVADLDLASGSVVVRAAKRGQSRTLPLPKAALPHLERYLREGRPAFLRPDGRDRGHFLISRFGKPLTTNVIGDIMRDLTRRAGTKATAHAFRRSSATDMVRAGINLECVRQVLGHTRLSTTAIYVDVSRADMRKAVEKLDALKP